jgi:SAM-dependent methyltransferase
MPRSAIFEANVARYEAWFARHPAAYVSELLALRPFVPLAGRGLEIGVGTGRFAAPLGVAVGLDPSPAMLAQARRVLKPGGRLVIGFIDRESSLGQHYLAHRNESVFYREATFVSADEVERWLAEAGFSIAGWGQTLSRPLPETLEIEPARPGRGQCAFVVVSATAS